MPNILQSQPNLKIPKNWFQTQPSSSSDQKRASEVRRTKSIMEQERKLNNRPHISFDIDGDGVVSVDDYKSAVKFNKACDGILK